MSYTRVYLRRQHLRYSDKDYLVWVRGIKILTHCTLVRLCGYRSIILITLLCVTLQLGNSIIIVKEYFLGTVHPKHGSRMVLFCINQTNKLWLQIGQRQLKLVAISCQSLKAITHLSSFLTDHYCLSLRIKTANLFWSPTFRTKTVVGVRPIIKAMS